MEPDDLLCSRNARPQKALVGRAQWKINQPPSLKRQRASLEGLSVASLDGRGYRLLMPLLGKRGNVGVESRDILRFPHLIAVCMR
jgi:hypothetical protein